jgi:hypothetical protein
VCGGSTFTLESKATSMTTGWANDTTSGLWQSYAEMQDLTLKVLRLQVFFETGIVRVEDKR